MRSFTRKVSPTNESPYILWLKHFEILEDYILPYYFFILEIVIKDLLLTIDNETNTWEEYRVLK